MTKEIKLANNKGIVLVDDEDYNWLNQFKWSLNHGYAHANLREGKNKNVRMHRLLLNVAKEMQTDHIDNNRLNNQKNNLRVVTNLQNIMNKSSYKNRTSNYKGVHYEKQTKRWRSLISLNNNRFFLGRFKIEIDAAKAYNEKAIELFGEYAKLNEV